ncbi:hypothetical protein M8J77_011553 [Diaphorina citri]|nr:hypothetical protein M8J77_011553 [Diaphorina citri]
MVLSSRNRREKEDRIGESQPFRERTSITTFFRPFPFEPRYTMADTSATEIRCEEKSKGGIKYDVILAEPAGTPPPLKTAADTPVILRSESIEEKLKQAEERRLSLEAEKIAKNAARRSKIEDAAKKRDEKENEFIEQTKETLEKRLEISSEKREALINDKMEKLKDHDRRVEEARLKKEKLEDSKENGCEETTPSG